MEDKEKKIALSKRMKAILAMLPEAAVLVDVGTDHGMIPIAAVLEGKAKRAVAMDLREGPLSRAREHIAAYGLSEVITTRLSDGLVNAREDELDVVVIAGMGGELVIKILKDAGALCRRVRYFILQPQSEIDEVRAFLRENGFGISDEAMVEDRKKFYPMMLVAASAKTGSDAWKIRDAADDGQLPSEFCKPSEQQRIRVEDLYGPCLLKKKDAALQQYLKWQEGQLAEIFAELLKQPDSEKIRARREEINERIAYNRLAQHRMKDAADAEKING